MTIHYRSAVLPASNFLLPVGLVHVWRVDLQAVGGAMDRRVLSSDELKRASQYHFTKDRDRFLARRFALRQILSNYVPLPPQALVFQSNEWGKPRLVDAGGHCGIEFNVSFSQGLALIAVAHETQVGIDLEFDEPRIDCLSLAERFFSVSELQTLRRLTGASQRAAFFTQWTRKEARGKAIGHGVSPELAQSAVEEQTREDSGGSPIEDFGGTPSQGLWFPQLELGCSGYFAALCTSRAVAQLVYFTFPRRSD